MFQPEKIYVQQKKRDNFSFPCLEQYIERDSRVLESMWGTLLGEVRQKENHHHPRAISSSFSFSFFLSLSLSTSAALSVLNEKMRSFDDDEDDDSDDSEGEVADEGDWYASLIAGERVGEWLDVIE